jgi:hypothetical protein
MVFIFFIPLAKRPNLGREKIPSDPHEEGGTSEVTEDVGIRITCENIYIKQFQATYNIHPLLLGAKRTSFILEGRIF